MQRILAVLIVFGGIWSGLVGAVDMAVGVAGISAHNAPVVVVDDAQQETEGPGVLARPMDIPLGRLGVFGVIVGAFAFLFAIPAFVAAAHVVRARPGRWVRVVGVGMVVSGLGHLFFALETNGLARSFEESPVFGPLNFVCAGTIILAGIVAVLAARHDWERSRFSDGTATPSA